MNCFQVSRIMTAQGIDAQAMADVLQSLHTSGLLPKWGTGQTGAELSPRDIVSIILGSTAPEPGKAAEHVVAVAGLSNGVTTPGANSTFGEDMISLMYTEPHFLKVDKILVSGQSSSIHYTNGIKGDYTSADESGEPGRTFCISGSLLQAIGIKLHFPTAGGWSENPKED